MPGPDIIDITDDELDEVDSTLVVLLRGDMMEISSDMTDEEIRGAIEALEHSLSQSGRAEYVH